MKLSFRKLSFLSAFLFILCLSALAQHSSSQAAADSLKRLSFMTGSWKGEGWMMMGKEKKEFIQTETITPKVSETLYVVDGLGRAKGTAEGKGKIIHDAFGFITYDSTKNALLMTAFSTAGGKTEAQIHTIGQRKLQWEFTAANGGRVRFTEDFSSEGIWLEVGEYLYAPGQWMKFFEMKLLKQ